MHFAITWSKSLWIHETIAEWIYFDNVMTEFIVYNRTDAWKTAVHLFFYDKLSNCSLSLVAASRKFQIHVSVHLLTIQIGQWARKNVIVKLYRASQWFQVFPRLVLSTWFPSLITYRANLLRLLGLLFLKHENTFGNKEGMISWCRLAEHACIKLVSLFKRILKRNFINASLLGLILTRLFHLNVKENRYAAKHSVKVEQQKDFSI